MNNELSNSIRPNFIIKNGECLLPLEGEVFKDSEFSNTLFITKKEHNLLIQASKEFCDELDAQLLWGVSTKEQSSIDNLHNFIFHYNSITKNWEVVNRDDYHLLFSDNNNNKVLKSKSFDTLRELIIRTNGDQDKINELLIK